MAHVLFLQKLIGERNTVIIALLLFDVMTIIVLLFKIVLVKSLVAQFPLRMSRVWCEFNVATTGITVVDITSC